MICGVDEAGRGPLCGPVFAAAVVLDPARPISGLNDSKKLGERVRLRLAEGIRQRAAAWCVAQASVEEIDAINILQATLLAMRRAVEGLSIAPSQVLVDGLYTPRVNCAAQAVVKGDASVAEISAASILAKTARDALMCDLDARYPQYGLARHKGYPTAAHLAALREHGVIDIYRRSFAPVRRLLRGEPQVGQQSELRGI
jgi:ribonuclease HII